MKPASRLERFKAQHPICCFCGGERPTQSIDHVLSRQTFALKRRPQGLEFPACTLCNASTSKDEQVVALLSRIYPDSRSGAERKELGEIMNAAGNNHPGLLLEMLPPSYVRAQYPGGKVVNLGGSKVRACLERFSEKLLLALHYEFTKKIVPMSGGVRGHLVFERRRDARATSVYLAVGRWAAIDAPAGVLNVADQFSYSGLVLEDGAISAYFVAFRRAFAIGGMVCMDRAWFDSDGSPIDRVLRRIA